MLREGAFGSGIDAEDAQLEGVFVACVVAVAQVHVEDPREGVAVFGRKGSRVEIRIAEHLAAQGREPAAAETRNFGKVVRVGNLHPFHPPLQELRGVAPHHDAVVADRRGDTGERRNQPCRVIHAAGIAARLLDTQHAAAGKGHFIQRFGLVDTGPDNHLLDGNQTLLQADFEHHLLGRADEYLLEQDRFITQTAHLQVMTPDRDPPQYKPPQRIARRAGRRLQVGYHDRGIRNGMSAVLFDNNAPDGL